jgi:hypothetical protein
MRPITSKPLCVQRRTRALGSRVDRCRIEAIVRPNTYRFSCSSRWRAHAITKCNSAAERPIVPKACRSANDRPRQQNLHRGLEGVLEIGPAARRARAATAASSRADWAAPRRTSELHWRKHLEWARRRLATQSKARPARGQRQSPRASSTPGRERDRGFVGAVENNVHPEPTPRKGV